MNNKELIITLIKQDMKHNQLVLGLQQLGLSCDDYHYLQIYRIIAELMGYKKGVIDEKWLGIYLGYIDKVIEHHGIL